MSHENLPSQEQSSSASPAPIAASNAARPASIDESGSPVSRAFRRVLRQPTFVAAVVVLLTAALGLNASVQFMKLHFKKEPMPLSRELGSISDRFGTWVQVSQDQALDKEMQDELATDKYIFRDYADTKLLGADVAEQFKDKSVEERRGLAGEKRRRNAASIVSMSVTYYTGMVDTVAHVPDRCVTADGYEPKSYITPKWPIARDLPRARKPDGDNVEVRYINFEDQTGTSNVPRSITYFFHCNGGFVSDPLGVRRRLANLFETKGYYCKIEVMTTIRDEAESARVMTDFLTNAMPEIIRC
ncbi:MAG: hypothetical protein ABI024_10040, partial [Vicinamibacterales bacterium]